MGDEQVQESVETPEVVVEETPDETQPLEDEETSEKTEITPDDSNDRGDLRVPLKEERTKRQQLEELVRDPRFIAEQAARMGLVGNQPPQAPVDDQRPLTAKEVEEIYDYKQAVKDFPEVAKDPELLAYAGTLKDIYPSLSYHDAMAKAHDRFAKAKEAGQVEGKAKAKAEVDEKLKAQTVSNTQTPPGEVDDLDERLKSPDRKVHEDALVELMMKRNKKMGIG